MGRTNSTGIGRATTTKVMPDNMELVRSLTGKHLQANSYARQRRNNRILNQLRNSAAAAKLKTGTAQRRIDANSEPSCCIVGLEAQERIKSSYRLGNSESAHAGCKPAETCTRALSPAKQLRHYTRMANFH